MDQANDTLPVKFYVDDTNQVTLQCPQCGASRTMDVSKFKTLKKEHRIRCKCGQSFRCFLEFRRHYRKEVKFAGEYLNFASNKKGVMIVTNISLSGVGFRSVGPHKIQPGDELELRFRLDDKQRTELRFRVEVRSVRDLYVGTQISDMHNYKEAYGFYFMCG